MPAFHISCLLLVAAALEPTRRMQPSKAFLRQVHLNTSLVTATVALEPTAAPTAGCSADTVDYNALNVPNGGCCAYDTQCISKFCGAAWKCAPAPASPSSTRQTVSNPFQRVWMVCKQKAPHAPTVEETAADMETLEPANCTDEMSFESLCCARWEDKDFKHPGFMMLSSSKYNDTGGKSGSASDEGGRVIKVCTQAVNGMALMSKARNDVAKMPVECSNAHITAEQLSGESDGLQPGEIILRTRLLYFAGQQIPMSSVPKCEKEVATCSDGKEPTIVQAAWLQKVQPRAGALVQVSARNNFGGAPMTSGSFTMMAASGDHD